MDEPLELRSWYWRLGRLIRESWDSAREDLYDAKESLECVRVWKKGIVGGRERSSYAAPELRLLSRGVETRFSAADVKVVVVEIDDLLRLCRDVRLSSRGFISGGKLVIFRKVTARYSPMIKDMRCNPPPMAPSRKTTRENSATNLVFSS
jgi:hypothetical protein